MMRVNLWNRRFVSCTAIVLILCVAALALPHARAAHAQDDILRLHILANSDSIEDQRVKLLVRDALLQTMPACDSAAETEAYLLDHGAEVLATAERILRENGFSYGAQLLLGKCMFPDRTYDGVTYPAGEYEALRVVLGRGAGQNWWCVLFPPLCIVTLEQQPLGSFDELEFESSILGWLNAPENDAEGGSKNDRERAS